MILQASSKKNDCSDLFGHVQNEGPKANNRKSSSLLWHVFVCVPKMAQPNLGHNTHRMYLRGMSNYLRVRWVLGDPHYPVERIILGWVRLYGTPAYEPHNLRNNRKHENTTKTHQNCWTCERKHENTKKHTIECFVDSLFIGLLFFSNGFHQNDMSLLNIGSYWVLGKIIWGWGRVYGTPSGTLPPSK